MIRSQCLQRLSYAWFCGVPQGQDLPCTAASDETSGIQVIPVPKKVVPLVPLDESLASSKSTKEDEFETPFDWVFTSQEIPSLDAVASGCTDQHIVRSRSPSLMNISLERVTSMNLTDTDRDVGCDQWWSESAKGQSIAPEDYVETGVRGRLCKGDTISSSV